MKEEASESIFTPFAAPLPGSPLSLNIPRLNSKEGGRLTVRVCSDAVLCYFWCGFAVIFIVSRGIAVSKHYAVYIYYTFKWRFTVKKKVSAVITLFRIFRTVGIRLFYNASGFIISA